ncbi:MAG: amidohydrolase family protein [Acidimicrobiales bacterium]
MTALQVLSGQIIDCMISVNPGDDMNVAYIPKEAFRDDESLEAWPSPAVVKYLFRGADGDRVFKTRDASYVVNMLDEWGIDKVCVAVTLADAPKMIEGLENYGDRWFFTLRVNPHDGMRAVRRLNELVTTYPNVKACSLLPHTIYPPIPPNSKEYYPIYAKCIELDIPVFVTVGIPGPRVPGWTQDPLYLDEVCWFFPELKIVMKHGGEPWTEMCVKLMLKWENLYFITSGFAPKYYSEAIINYANTRGSDKVIFAGYWPMLSYEDIFAQLENLPLRDHVWSKMFSENARRLFRL